MATIGSFLLSLGVDSSKLETGLKGAEKGLMGFNLTATAVITTMSLIINKTMDYVVMLDKFSKTTGLSSQELQKWGAMAQLSNVSIDAVASSVKNLNRNRIDFMMGKGNLTPYALLGIDPRSKPFEVLDKLRDKVNRLDPALASNLLSQLGVSEEMMVMFKSSDATWQKFNQGLLLTDKQQKSMMKYNQSWQLFKLNLDFMSKRFAIMVSTVLRPFIEVLGKIISIIGNFIGIFQPLIDIFEWLGDKIGNSSNSLDLFIVALIGLIGIFAPVIAGISAIILVIEDLYIWFKGGDSLFKRWLTPLFESTKIILDSIKSMFQSFMDWFNDSWAGKVLDKLGKAKDYIKDMFGDEKFDIGLPKQSQNMSSVNNTANNNVNSSSIIQVNSIDDALRIKRELDSNDMMITAGGFK